MTRRILLVEDEPDLLHALSLRLAAAGFVCRTAANGKEGAALAQAWAPELIIADLLMPEMDGYDFIRVLRKQPSTAGIPIIVLTAVPTFARQARLDELRVAQVIQKPFDSERLLLTIRQLLGDNALRQEGSYGTDAEDDPRGG